MGDQQHIFDLTSAYTPVVGTRYWAAYVRTDGIGTDVCRCFTGTDYVWDPIGFEGEDIQFRLPDQSPDIGDTLDGTTTNFVPGIGFIYEYFNSQYPASTSTEIEFIIGEHDAGGAVVEATTIVTGIDCTNADYVKAYFADLILEQSTEVVSNLKDGRIVGTSSFGSG